MLIKYGAPCWRNRDLAIDVAGDGGIDLAVRRIYRSLRTHGAPAQIARWAIWDMLTIAADVSSVATVRGGAS